MRFAVTSIIIFIGAVALALFMYYDPGYVIIDYGEWTIESSLILLLLLNAAAFITLYALIRFWVFTRDLPQRLQRWRQLYRLKKVRQAFYRGLTALAAGHWEQAERLLTDKAPESEHPLLNYLGAAYCAEQLGETVRRDSYLKLAHESNPEEELAVGMVQAELQRHQGQLERARTVLMRLLTQHTKHPYLHKVMGQVFAALRDWDHLLELLPALRKYKAMDQDQADTLEKNIYRHRLGQAARLNNLAALQQTWQDLPKAWRLDQTLLYDYCRYLLGMNAASIAEPLLAEAIDKQWNSALVYLFGLCETSDPIAQLQRGEKWLRGHETDPILLLTLGRICMRNRLWGKTRSYLETSISIRPHAETYKQLGALLERLNERERAMECYSTALNLLLENKPILLFTPSEFKTPEGPRTTIPLMARDPVVGIAEEESPSPAVTA